MPARVPRSAATPEPAATPPVEATPAAVVPAPVVMTQAPSVVERLRRNRMGALLGGFIVATILALLLSVLVPDSNLLLALILLGLGEAIAVGFTVRYLSDCRGLRNQVTAFVLAAVGVHLLATTGMVNQKIGDLGGLVSALTGSGGGAVGGLGWDDALLSALATPTISTGAIMCGLVAAIIAGWGAREVDHSHS